jgi:hypothetical protein
MVCVVGNVQPKKCLERIVSLVQVGSKSPVEHHAVMMHLFTWVYRCVQRVVWLGLASFFGFKQVVG